MTERNTGYRLCCALQATADKAVNASHLTCSTAYLVMIFTEESLVRMSKKTSMPASLACFYCLKKTTNEQSILVLAAFFPCCLVLTTNTKIV
jgi:hypothetical protein